MEEIPDNSRINDDSNRNAGNYRWKGAKVLLVEDNLANQQLGVVVLGKFGIQTDVVDNGIKAVEALKLKNYDMVLMDLQMPEMDGLEATSIIRQPESGVLNPSVVIVALTANAFSSDKKRCFEVGMNDYVSKPFVPETLYGILNKYLSNFKLNNYDKNVGNTSLMSSKDNDIFSGESDNLPVFDCDAFMDRIMHDQKIMAIVLNGFLRDMPSQVEKLRGLISLGDCIAAGRQAHSIKGAAANIGGEVLRSISSLLEVAGKEGKLDDMKNNISDLEIEFEKLIAVLTDFMQKSKIMVE